MDRAVQAGPPAEVTSAWELDQTWVVILGSGTSPPPSPEGDKGLEEAWPRLMAAPVVTGYLGANLVVDLPYFEPAVLVCKLGAKTPVPLSLPRAPGDGPSPGQSGGRGWMGPHIQAVPAIRVPGPGQGRFRGMGTFSLRK